MPAPEVPRPEATSTFCRSYGPLVRRLLEARWRDSPMTGELEDAAQEVFVECLRPEGALSRVDPHRGGLSAMLFGVTRNVARRYEERAARRAGLAAGASAMLDGVTAREESMSLVLDREWARSLLRMAGDRMRDAARTGDDAAQQRVELLHLRFTQGVALAEVAERWGADPAAIHRAYARARSEFREHLRRVVSEHSVRAEEQLDDEVERVLRLLRG